MAPERLTIVAAMAVASYALRVVPQILLTGWSFPASWDRYLRLLAYALVAGIVSVALYLSAGHLDAAAVPRRTLALAIAVFVTVKTRSAVTGMIIGTVVILFISWSAR
ncbi:MAG TPA: AzlD domain-containing protein [Candidatus Binatia bacterium]|jgi:branched-subunit amino acid transport protein